MRSTNTEQRAERAYHWTRLGVMAGVVWVVFCLGLVGWTASSSAAPKASIAKQRKAKQPKKKAPKPAPVAAPVNLVPHVQSVSGEWAVLCEIGIYCSDAPEIASSFASCPSGYIVVAGGWETYGGEFPQNAIVVQNHPISTRWLVEMESTFVRGKVLPPPTKGRFRAVAQCQILLPA